MTVVDRQFHGYRQGHQLLATSVQLPKEDQSIVDRLSDVAGPLRPRETFDPYLTAYPLPSGEWYVLARTWQDPTVSRAGCVRTISLIIPAAKWASSANLMPFVDLLKIDHLPQDSDAKRAMVEDSCEGSLPPVPAFRASELLEALFLEDAKPVAVFDAPQPELTALRLLTALWPSMRRRFAVSTFALSPRKVGGRDFDLVFAPKDARAKFSDWHGRRVDGRSEKGARHRWTGKIIERVFEQPVPKLLTPNEVGLIDDAGLDFDNTASLRIALLWDELLAKLDTTPTAALGLLDIANSGKVRDSLALGTLEPSLAEAARRGARELPEGEAWSFLGAMARKMQGRSLPLGIKAVGSAAEDLARRSPEGAVALLSQDDPRGVAADLLPRIAAGIGSAFHDRTERALLAASPEVFGRLVAEGGALITHVADHESLIIRLSEVIPQLDTGVADALARDLLPLLTADWQVPAAEPLVARLDGEQLADEIQHLGAANDFAAERFVRIVLERAKAVGAEQRVISSLSKLPPTERRDALLASLLSPSIKDVRWLVNGGVVTGARASAILVTLLRAANDRQFIAALVDKEVGEAIVSLLRQLAPDLVERALFIDGLPVETFAELVRGVFDTLDRNAKFTVAERALRRCLGSQFGGDEAAFLSAMLGAIGDRLDGAWAARLGLSRGIHASLASRNMVAFRRTSRPAKLRVVWSIAEVAEVLRDRRQLDLSGEASEAFAHFLFDSEKVTPAALVVAAGHLLPMLLRSRDLPASLMIAATFPPLYRELAKKDDNDLLRLLPFFHWDRCKAARHELVSAFMSSSWPPEHLALTACRCNEVGKILCWTAKSLGGEDYIKRISAGAARLPEGCRKPVERTIAAIRSGKTSKYD